MSQTGKNLLATDSHEQRVNILVVPFISAKVVRLGHNKSPFRQSIGISNVDNKVLTHLIISDTLLDGR